MCCLGSWNIVGYSCIYFFIDVKVFFLFLLDVKKKKIYTTITKTSDYVKRINGLSRKNKIHKCRL